MRVQIACSRTMLKTNDVTVLEETDGSIEVQGRLVPTRVDDPFIVVVLVVIARHLLLVRAHRIRLNMGMEKTSTIPHILERHFRSKCDLWEDGWDELLAMFHLKKTHYQGEPFRNRSLRGSLGTMNSFVSLRGQSD